ncbi:MAG: STAS domain-containing protein [Planctomycetota bacterium]|nr:STAS domain-containing protein [Planctomycetota bacterium]
MSKLETHLEELPGVENGAVLTLSGSLESDSLPLLQETIQDSERRGFVRIAVEATNLEYVNRAGFMVMVNFSKRLLERDGALVLTGLTPKVERIFDMLGLRTFLKVVTSLDQATQALANGDIEEFNENIRQTLAPVESDHLGDASATQSDEFDFDAALKQAESESSQNEVQVEENPFSDTLDDDPLAAVLEAGLAEENHLGQSEEMLSVDEEREDGAHFPIFLLCEDCSANLQVERSGPYRCPRCGSLFRVMDDGEYEFVQSVAPRPIRMEIPSTVEATRGLIAFLHSVAKPVLEESEVAQLQRALGSVCKFVRDIAFEGQQKQSFQVLIVADNERVVVEIADSGKRVEPAAVRAEVRPHVDLVEVKPRLGGGNLYKIVKKTKPAAEETPGRETS